MTPLRQHYSLTADDRLLHYDEAVRILRAQGEPDRYYCPGCNREVHISLNTRSFIHNTSRRCMPEIYIHNLAVHVLHSRFYDKAKDLTIGTKRTVLCRESKTCPFYSGGYECWGDDIVRYGLKKIYDICDYASDGPDFHADLVILDSTGKKPPVYLLVRTDYLAPLNLPPDVLLIEIAVKDEFSAVALSREAFLEGGEKVNCQFYGPWKRRGGVSERALCEKG